MSTNPAFQITESTIHLDIQQKDANETDKQKIVPERKTWSDSRHFLMSCIAMSVGLGNVWRFPFAAYENGGGAFLVPYIIVLALVGRPIYYLEMCIGQFTSQGNVKVFKLLAPALRGVGYGQLFGTICVTTYYLSIMAITLFYLINSFTSNLPWSDCNPSWDLGAIQCVPSGQSRNLSLVNVTTLSSSELYFTKEVIHEKYYIDDGIGLPDWKLTILLFASWFILFIVTSRGMRSSGKTSYFLAIFPYIILCALLIRAVTLEGAVNGIVYFLNPQWDKLLSAKVWYNAITQCFFSLNIGVGSLIIFSSINDFRHNIYRDALIITGLDTIASLLSGITIFGILGNLAHELKVDVTEVIGSGGARLAFVSYPDAIAKFDTIPWLFSILFFGMLFVLGIGSLVAMQGVPITVLKETCPKLKNWHVSAITAIIGFIIGLVYITPGGQFILSLVDYFGVTFVYFVITTIEVVVVVWWYGLENFCQDIEFMLNRKVGIYWRICWGIITPCALIAIFLYFVFSIEKLKNGIYDYPDSVIGVGWVLSIIGISQPLIWWIYHLYKHRKPGLKQAISESLSFKNWGPTDPQLYEEWKKFKLERAQEKATMTRHPWWKEKLYLLVGKE